MKLLAAAALVLALAACKKKEADPAASPPPAPTAPTPSGPSAPTGTPTAGQMMTPVVAAAVEREVTEGTPLELGNGVSVALAKADGRHTVAVTCGGKNIPVLDNADGGEAKVSVRSAGTQATIVMTASGASEGESTSSTQSAQLDLSTCTVTK